MMLNFGAEEVKIGRVVDISPTKAVELGGKCILEFPGPMVMEIDFVCGLWWRSPWSDEVPKSSSLPSG